MGSAGARVMSRSTVVRFTSLSAIVRVTSELHHQMTTSGAPYGWVDAADRLHFLLFFPREFARRAVAS